MTHIAGYDSNSIQIPGAGTLVETWEDFMSGFDFEQPDEAYRPHYVDAGVNGYRTVYLNSGQFMESTLLFGDAEPFTIVAVVAPSFHTTGDRGIIIGSVDWFLGIRNNKFVLDAGGIPITFDYPVVHDQPVVVTAVQDNLTSIKLYLNSTLAGTSVPIHGPGTLRLGQNLKAHIPEMLMFNEAFTDEQVSGLVGDLTTKYDIPAFPSGELDPEFGEGYFGGMNLPSRMRVVAALGEGGELIDISNNNDYWVDRESFHGERINENGSSATFGFTLIVPGGSFADIIPNRYVAIDDLGMSNDDGGYAGLFAGYIMGRSPTEEAKERVVQINCVDYGVLAHQPPHQISTQWPPDDGTPVVNTTVEESQVAGSSVSFFPKSTRHLYPGKKVYAQNSDGSNKERITIISVNHTTGEVVADFVNDHTSTETTVQMALHATGVQEIEPDSMDNINVGSIVYCKKTHGQQHIGNEYVVVTAVTSTTFTASFTAWKAHDWLVRSYWQLIGGITDRELIADGWKQHVDILNEDGEPEMVLADVESLIDHCYTNADPTYQVIKQDVQELILSLPHGKWSGQTPADVLNWVVQQSEDPLIRPRWYFTFQQANTTGLSIYPPMLRYYNSVYDNIVAPLTLTNAPGELNPATQARYTKYNYPEEGSEFANKLTVLGANFSEGSWIDQDSISEPSASNYVGRIIEAKPITDTTCTTNEECALRAEKIAVESELSVRKKAVTTTTYARLAPFVLYEPHRVNFDAQYEQDLPQELDVKRVAIDFSGDGLAKYSLTLGSPKKPWSGGPVIPGHNIRRANAKVDSQGKVSAAFNQNTKYVFDHDKVQGEADLYIVDTSDEPLNMYLPPASTNPGLPITIKVPVGAANPATVHAFQQHGIEDTIDGAPTLELSPGQSVTLQSSGEHDQTGLGGVWHATGTAGEGTVGALLQGGNSFTTDLVYGTNDEYDVVGRRFGVEVNRLVEYGEQITGFLDLVPIDVPDPVPDKKGRVAVDLSGYVHYIGADGVDWSLLKTEQRPGKTEFHYVNFLLSLPQTTKRKVQVPFGKIMSWTLEGDISGSVVVEIHKDAVDGPLITGDTPPELDSEEHSTGSPDGTWDTFLFDGDELYFDAHDDIDLSEVTVSLKVVHENLWEDMFQYITPTLTGTGTSSTLDLMVDTDDLTPAIIAGVVAGDTLDFEIGSPSVMNVVRLVQPHPLRYASSIRIWGSDDGSSWTAIQTVGSITAGTLYHTMSQTTPYSWYRIEVVSLGAGNDGSWQIHALEVTGLY